MQSAATPTRAASASTSAARRRNSSTCSSAYLACLPESLPPHPSQGDGRDSLGEYFALSAIVRPGGQSRSPFLGGDAPRPEPAHEAGGTLISRGRKPTVCGAPPRGAREAGGTLGTDQSMPREKNSPHRKKNLFYLQKIPYL